METEGKGTKEMGTGIKRKRKTGKKLKTALLLLCMSILLVTGCGQQDEEAVDILAGVSTSSSAGAGDAAGTGNAQGTGDAAENGSSGAALEIPVCTLDTSDMFTDRDKEVGFDENADTVILLSGTTASCDSDAVEITGGTITITDEGTYILSGSLTEGSIVIDAEDTDKLQLVLNGADITCATSAAIYVKQADKVFITLAPNSDNSLATTGEFVAIDDNHIDAVIFSKDDLTLNGSGTLHISCTSGHGIVSKDDLVITGGDYDITASGHGLSGKDSVRIAAGDIVIEAGTDGIHSENDDDATLGFVYMEDGNITITAGDDGIHAGNQVLIAGGTLHITESYEGIEGLTIDIAGGEVTVNSNDDGLNAADGSSETAGGMGQNPNEVTEGAYIHISGGSLNITAYGDGIDSNGNFYVTGGETYVSGPENSGNGSIDYAGTGLITGGVFVAAGASGMAQNFGSSSTQCAMLVNLSSSQSAGTTVSLQDADGQEIISFAPQTLYSCVVISCPGLQTGSTYTLTAGTESTDITLTDTIYGSENGMGGGFGGGRGSMGGGFDGGERGSMRMEDMDGELPEGELDGEPPQPPEGGLDGEPPQPR